jgi:CrcB protein
MSRWTLVLLMAGAGAAGTLVRWGIASAANRLTPGWGWPGTLAVNLLGCLVFGIVWGLSEKSGVVSPQAKLVVLTGFLGAFTTFSAFAYDTGQLMRAGRLWAAGANVAANNVLGIALFFAGAWVVGALRGAR